MTNSRTFRRDEAARLLQSHGMRTTAASLATMATRGGGPPYFKIGKLCMYRLCDLEDWMSKRCSGLLDSTSTMKGRQMNELFESECDLEDDLFHTGQPEFDEVTRLLEEEAEMQEFIDTAGTRYDQQFVS